MMLSQTMLLIIALAGLFGLLIGMMFSSFTQQRKNRQQLASIVSQYNEKIQLLEQQLEGQKDRLTEQSRRLELAHQEQLQTQRQLGELEQKKQQVSHYQEQLLSWQNKAQTTQDKANHYFAQLESQAAAFEQERIASQDKLDLLASAELRLQQQFENLANKIFEHKQQKFTQSSKAGLDALLSPLKEQIEGFKKQVTDQYVKEGQERASLKTEILGLKELNQQITQEAAALTKALKGDNKQQGNWGEVILERILTESGLREGHEFETQKSLKNDAGKLYQPDVVVHLPNEKDIVVDSKVSLAHYERYFNQQSDEIARQEHLKAHVNSLRQHIRELGKKNYQDLKGIRTLDYVLMFVPIESAFLLAIDQAPELVKMALDNNIMLVSPTNLLVALRTVNNIWQYEYQNQNAQRIAQNAAKLYDKFHGFITDMEKIGRSIETLDKSYLGAMNKLSNGKGNLVRQVEQFRELGVQTNKKLDSQILQDNDEGSRGSE
ncbi:DNA recombination protein RmuC [Aliiglaciecola sp. LCG003]|uniref:DNA recombination protein RmuC n=1 Tax=Aliiglaciecola sp. LCG003 TaxID=3053655 RepID=UPI002573BFD4|nr:DNA recombination protein RmuC [Aliiglaciecola sp. LCG003]WJG11015.1 DNA recombination protein RmuC [Aliiglaciecola sp. LCG003]